MDMPGIRLSRYKLFNVKYANIVYPTRVDAEHYPRPSKKDTALLYEHTSSTTRSSSAKDPPMQEPTWDVTSSEEYGIRQSFQCWPSSRIEATRCVAPLGCLYTPLKEISANYMPQVALQYEPIRCVGNQCRAVLNPYCQVDFMSKLWTCPFCLTRNHFPPHYAENISETNLPAELIPQYATCEYELPINPHDPYQQQQQQQGSSPAFLFVVDTCVHAEELAELADSIQVSLLVLLLLLHYIILNVENFF